MLRFVVRVKQTRTATVIVAAASQEQIDAALQIGGGLAMLLDELHSNPSDFEDAEVETETEGWALPEDAEDAEVPHHAYVNAAGEFTTTR